MSSLQSRASRWAVCGLYKSDCAHCVVFLGAPVSPLRLQGDARNAPSRELGTRGVSPAAEHGRTKDQTPKVGFETLAHGLPQGMAAPDDLEGGQGWGEE